MHDSEYLIDPVKHLQKLKKQQYRRELFPILTVALGILLQFWLRNLSFMLYPLLAITLAGVAWYLWVMANHRTQNKISRPEPDEIVSPIEGKVNFIRGNQDTVLVNIKKSWLDVVEIRCPHEECIWEEDQIKLQTQRGKISFRFNSEELTWLEKGNWESGSMIGMMTGPGSCTITFPTDSDLEIREGQLVFSGMTNLMNLKAKPKSHKSILVEEQVPGA